MIWHVALTWFQISLCFLPPQIDGSLLGGTIDHHHHPHHEHDHDHGDGGTNHSNKSDPHTHRTHIQGEVEASTPISAVSNLLSKTEKNDKHAKKSSSGTRKGRKFNRTAKRREKKIDLLKKNRPFGTLIWIRWKIIKMNIEVLGKGGGQMR